MKRMKSLWSYACYVYIFNAAETKYTIMNRQFYKSLI